MNKTRFYEIFKAAKTGELDKFVPTNAAEAELIANLAIGSGNVQTGGSTGGSTDGSTGGASMVVSPYNNPDLPNLYYGMDLMNKKLYVDFPKLAEYHKAQGMDLSISLRSLGSGGMNFDIYQYTFIMPNGVVRCSEYHGFRIDGSGPANGWEEVFGYQHADLDMTVEQLFNSYGTACLDLGQSNVTNFNPESKIMVILDGVLGRTINLNETPIDFIWFE